MDKPPLTYLITDYIFICIIYVMKSVAFMRNALSEQCFRHLAVFVQLVPYTAYSFAVELSNCHIPGQTFFIVAVLSVSENV